MRHRLIGHKGAEQEMLSAYREGRLAHAWLIGGREGIGKATLAWRFARFVLANPDPAATAVREARDLNVDPGHPAARLLAQLAHPDFALIRREWQAATKKLASEISVDAVRLGLQVFQLSAAFGGWRVAIVDCAEDLNRNSANALLKMVEEPPQRSLILIVSHRPGQVLATIRSRCRRLRLDPLSEDEVVEAVDEPRAAVERSRLATRSPPPPDARTDRFARRWRASRRNRRGRRVLIDSIVAGLPRPDPRAVARLADAIGGRAGDEAYRGLPSRSSTTGLRLTLATSRRPRPRSRRSADFGTASAPPSARRKRSISTESCTFWRFSPRSPRPPRGAESFDFHRRQNALGGRA